uniref:ribonuclease Z n=1 Tax=Macrostomum lignano TaxID=282301 RepID=A0A1I8GRJ9_9PLAT
TCLNISGAGLQSAVNLHGPPIVIDGNELLIHPAQSKSILILDCATAEIAAQLALNDRLKSWICGASSADANCSAAEIDLVVHLAEPSVLRSNQYRAVIDLFRKSPLNSNAKHIVLDGQSRIPALYAAHQSQLMLNSLDSSIFPLLYGHRFMERQGDESKSPNNSGSATLSSSSSASAAASTNSESLADFPSSATSCAIFQEYLIRPPIGFNYQSTSVDRNIATAVAIATANSSAKCLAFTEAAMREKIFEDNEIHITRQEFNEKLLEFKADYGVRDDSDATTRCYPWLQFIGTASSNPSKYRNVSAILLHVSETTKILLDCGEGHPSATDELLRREADCQRGIFWLLKARHRAFAESGQSPSPCAFIGPRGFNRWLEFFSQHSGEDGMSDVAEAKDLQLFWLETFWGVTLHAEVAAQTRARFEKFVKNVLGLNKVC